MSLVLHCLPRLLLTQMLLLRLEMYVINVIIIIRLKQEWKSNRSENTLLQMMSKLPDSYFYIMIQFPLIIDIFCQKIFSYWKIMVRVTSNLERKLFLP